MSASYPSAQCSEPDDDGRSGRGGGDDDDGRSGRGGGDEGRAQAAGERHRVRRLHDEMRGVLGEFRHLLLERRRRVGNLVVRQLLVHHGVGEELDGFREVGAEAVHGVRHLLPGRGREEVGADHLRLPGHAKRGAVGGGSPRHALEEVGGSGDVRGLPLGAGGDVHADGDGGALRRFVREVDRGRRGE